MKHPRPVSRIVVGPGLLLALFLCLYPFGRKARGQSDDSDSPSQQSNSLESPESQAAHAPPPSATKQDGDDTPTGGPYGKGPGWVPGMPAPAKGKGKGDAAGGEKGDAEEPPREGLILYDQLRDVDSNGVDAGPAEPVPSQYVVQKGDTLWSICQRFFQNPYYWPKLWSFNDAITNPHWIYPGDLLTMHAPGQVPAAPVAAGEKPEVLPKITRSAQAMPTGLFLHQNGFVEPNERDSAGTINGSREEKIMLASFDEIYIEMNKKKPLKVKERYTVYRSVKEVRRPYGDKAYLGEVVEILGDVQVKQITSGGIARAVILEAFGSIERGDRVGPLRRTYKLVDPQRNKASHDAVVVAALQPSVLLDIQMLVFVDLGRDTGIEVGNRLYAFRRGDAYPGLLAEKALGSDDRRFPKEVVAELTIVDVRDKTAAGLITRSLQEIRVGDRVEARKGY